MKTTKLIAFVCLLVSGLVEMRPKIWPDAVAQAGVVEGSRWIAFGLFVSVLGLVLLDELLRAPEGYEDNDGFHFGGGRERADRFVLSGTRWPIWEPLDFATAPGGER